ncbi:DUF952 domain-containing protein [Nocardioides sambongensis]|uniref:DUF952 domain-containing protein n=1 Tax=Nocardioides sambongensis TaxID=2589074 RepID=UPI0018C8934A|nr:DUF952 domain-containing protein [Nocardioides sambongensis]
MSTVFHLALSSDWAAAQAAGVYTVSTRGRSLAEEGFIHASRADQWTGVRDAFYADVTEPLVLLQIDTDLLDVPVVEEEAEPGSGVTFPHLYGPLRVDAVVRVLDLPGPLAPEPPDATGSTATPAPRPAAARSADGSTERSFTATYFSEMFRNAALILLVLACGFGAIALGVALGGDATPGIAGLLGTAGGVVVATWLYRRRGRTG